jgi:serine protease inhibitor
MYSRRKLLISGLAVASLAFIAAGCKGRTPYQAPAPLPVVDTDLRRDLLVADQVNALGLAVQRELPPGNLVWSPMETLSGGGVLLTGSSGRTHRELLKALQVHSFGAWQEGFPALSRRIHSSVPSWNSTSKLWTPGGSGVSTTFQSAITSFGAAVPGTLPAGGPTAVRGTFDQWFQTQGVGRASSSEAQPPAETSLALTGASRIDSPWGGRMVTVGSRYYRTGTQPLPVAMLRGTFSVRVAEYPDVVMAAIPLSGDAEALLLIPRSVDGLAEMENALTAERLRTGFNQMKSITAVVRLPAFDFASEVDITRPLRSLGAERPFNEEARWELMAKVDPGAWRLGAWRAASTLSLSARGLSSNSGDEAVDRDPGLADGNLPQIRADRPFLFGVVHRQTGALLMLARVVEAPAAPWIDPSELNPEDTPAR